jgi:hypothetical protein
MAVSCSARDVTVDLPVVAYVPAGCGGADAAGAMVTYAGLGDFPQPTQASEVVRLGSSGLALTALPAATREVVISPLLTDAVQWAGAALARVRSRVRACQERPRAPCSAWSTAAMPS